MGMKPEQQLDSSNSLSLSSKAARVALEPFFWAVENGLYSPEEFSFEVITKQTHFKAGRLNPEFPKNEDLRRALDHVLTSADEGLIKAEEFHFVVETELFQIELGSYFGGAFDDVPFSWNTDSSDSGDQVELCSNDHGVISCDTDSRDFDFNIKLRLSDVFFGNGALSIRFRWKEPPWIFLVVSLTLLLPMVQGSMVYKVGDPVTLREGDTGAIRFNDLWQPTDQPCDYVYVTISIEGLNHPFYVDGYIDPAGLVTPNQRERFSVIPIREGCSLEIEFIITSVRIEDEGMYMVEKLFYGASLNSYFMERQVMVYIPPGPATCFFTNSDYSQTLHEVHCHTRPGNGNTTLSCYQQGNKIPYQGEQAIVHNRIFWLIMNSPVSCCSHELHDTNVNAETCNQFKWPPTHTKVDTESPVTFPVTKIPTKAAYYEEFQTIESGCGHSRSQFWPTTVLIILGSIMGSIVSI